MLSEEQTMVCLGLRHGVALRTGGPWGSWLLQGVHEVRDRGRHAFIDAVVVAVEQVK